MRVFGIALFFMLIAVPAPLFAQQGSRSNASSSNTEVVNVSAQGGFVGGSKPDYFVGIDEVFDASAIRSTTRSNNRLTTTTRRTVRTTTTAQRRAGVTGGVSQLGSLGTQTVPSVSALDLSIAGSALQRPQQMAVEANLTRIQGIQNGQITFANSPAGTTAILTGTVASEGERRVAKQLLLLEPGIDRVENLLEVR